MHIRPPVPEISVVRGLSLCRLHLGTEASAAWLAALGGTQTLP